MTADDIRSRAEDARGLCTCIEGRLGEVNHSCPACKEAAMLDALADVVEVADDYRHEYGMAALDRVLTCVDALPP